MGILRQSRKVISSRSPWGYRMENKLDVRDERGRPRRRLIVQASVDSG